MVVGARSGPGEPEGQGPPVGAAEEEATAVNLGKSPDADGTRRFEQDGAGSGGSGSRWTVWGKRGPGGRAGAGESKKPRSFWKELPILIGIALVLALIIKTFLVQAFSIPSQSMQNTLQVGDRVLVDKLTPWFGSQPSRGEVVVFHDPGGWLEENPPGPTNPVTSGIQKVLSFIGLMPSAEEKDLIKRVIAVGGDTVECKGTGPVTVNGKALDEPYIFPGNTPCGDKPFGPIKIPPNRIWVMGDHRQDSLDSRYHQMLPGGGTVSVNQVVGRAIVVAWPVTRWSTLPIPSTFDQPGINAAAGAIPAAGGLAGALPLVLLRRRRMVKKQRKDC
ncbi:signal peptidase I [Streptantibioticus rubrisoli]|uniref:signal peptidase I n=1 Tax=Streptantibioticus rubrisoli TaxID=1387313 RepID=UPI003556B0BF